MPQLNDDEMLQKYWKRLTKKQHWHVPHTVLETTNFVLHFFLPDWVENGATILHAYSYSLHTEIVMSELCEDAW